MADTSKRRHGKAAVKDTLAAYIPEAVDGLARQQRFESSSLADNRFLELKRVRDEERKLNNDDILAPRKLGDAVTLIGTCHDMCPEFEREEREYQNNVDRLEMYPGTRRIDPSKAVKAYHRPAAGNEQPPSSDIRPPEVLKTTLDYLFNVILGDDPELENSHPFLRDRTRSVRQDFTVQNESGPIAIESNERIARFHIYCLHAMRGRSSFSESQELEQLRKVLQTLNEFYEDARHKSIPCPHEAEFRAYYLITHLRDADVLRQIELLPQPIFLHPLMQTALRVQALAQRNNESRGERGRRPANSEASLNGFSRLFKLIGSPKVSFLLACLLESHFTDIRRGALKSMRKAYLARYNNFEIDTLTQMLGCDDITQCAEVCASFELEVVEDEDSGLPVDVALHRTSNFNELGVAGHQNARSERLVGSKRGASSLQSVIAGDVKQNQAALPVPKTPKLPSPPRLQSSPKLPERSAKQHLSVTAPSFVPAAFKAAMPPTTSTAEMPIASPSFSWPAAPLATSSNPFGFAMPVESPKPIAIFSKSSTSKAPVVETNTMPLTKAVSKPSILSPVAKESLAVKPLKSPLRKSISDGTASHRPVASTSKLNAQAIADQLVDKLFASVLGAKVQEIAVDALTGAEEQDRQRMVAERADFIDDMANNLVDQALDERIRLVACKTYLERRLLSRYLEVWRQMFEERQEREAYQKERVGLLRTAATGLGAGGPSTVSPTYTEDHLDLNRLKITAASGSTDEQNIELLNTASETAHSFWAKGTFAEPLRALSQSLFSSIPAEHPRQWDIKGFLPSLDSTSSAWLRCKLGIDANSQIKQIIDSPNLHTSISLFDPEDLYTSVLDHTGLLIFDTSSEDDAEQTFNPKKIEGRLKTIGKRSREQSAYKPALLLLYWPSEDVAETRQELDALAQIVARNGAFFWKAECITVDANVDVALPPALQSLLSNWHVNTEKLQSISALIYLDPYLQAWKDGIDRFLDKSNLRDPNTLQQLGSLLQLLNKGVANACKLLKLRTFTSVPPMKVQSGSSLQDVLVQYCSAPQFASHFYPLLSVIQGSSSSIVVDAVPYFCDLLTSWLKQNMQQGITVSEELHMKWRNSVGDFEQTVNAAVSAILKALKQKRRSSSQIVQQSPPRKKLRPALNPARSKENISWPTSSKLAALQDLTASTVALLDRKGS